MVVSHGSATLNNTILSGNGRNSLDAFPSAVLISDDYRGSLPGSSFNLIGYAEILCSARWPSTAARQ